MRSEHDSPAPPRRPTWRLVFRHPAHFIALGGGAGLVPAAPGTAGTLLGLALYWLIAPALEPYAFLALIVAFFVVGVWACEMTGRALGAADHGGMVWDEVVAFMLVLFFVPATPAWQAAAFVLFRAFDITKPPPIRHFERRYHSGFGVMLDDLVAACYVLVILAVAKVIMA